MSIEAVDTRARGLRPRRAAEAIGATAFLRRLDWTLFAAVAATVAYGLWAIDGITRHDPGGSLMNRQALYAFVGVVLLVGATLVDPDTWRRNWKPIYGGTLGVMAFVLVAGAAARGSSRWIDFGPFRFQPSEFGKVLFALALAGYVAERGREVTRLDVALRTIMLAVLPIGLVFLQPDIGTALVYSAALAAVLFVGGTRWLHLALVGLAALVGVIAVLWALPAAGVNILKPYQAKRLTGFFNPSQDPQGATYNVNQSRTSIGAGQLRGRGVAGATQTRLNYLPEHATDFAFASLAEQRGFFGASILLMLYLLVVWRGLKIVAGARDLFGAVVAGAIVFAFLFQVFVNVGMTMAIAPITGIPLPFVSVGGSSMITNLAAIGLLQAIHARGGRRRGA